MPETVVADPSLPSIFWPTGTSGEGLSYEQLKQRRAIAAALASRSRPYPTTIGQGLSALGEGIGDRLYQERTDAYEREQAALDRKAREAAGGAPVPPPAVRSPARTSELVPPSEARKEVAALDERPDPLSTMVADVGPARADLARSALRQQGLEPPGSSSPPSPVPAGAGPAPMLTRYASLNTGTMSDAGQPGATYGGPSPAGPGASMAEPPVASPPTPSAPPPAAAAALPPGPVGTPAPGATGGGPLPEPVPRADLAGPVLAQAGVTPPVPRRAPTRVPTVRASDPPVIKEAPGVITQPPPAGPSAPATYPDPGQTRMNEPEPLEPRPKQPLIGQDTPAMAAIKRTLANPDFRNVSPTQREQMVETYRTLKEARDKQDAENLEVWRRDDAAWITKRDKRAETIRTLPKERLELSKAEADEIDRRRWGGPENKKAAEAAANKSGDAARIRADALPDLYKAIDLVRQNKVIGGLFAEGIPYTPLPGKLGVSKFMSEVGLGGLSRPLKSGPAHPYSDEAASTEEYQSLVRGILGANLKAQYGGNPSNVDLQSAEARYGLKLSLDNASKLRILENIKDEYLRSIQGHTTELRKNFNLPAHDAATLRRNAVDIPFDPFDVQQLRANRTAAAAQAFERRYGEGSAARALSGK